MLGCAWVGAGTNNGGQEFPAAVAHLIVEEKCLGAAGDFC